MVNKIVYQNGTTLTLESVDPRQPIQVYLNRFPGSIVVDTTKLPTDGEYYSSWSMSSMDQTDLVTDTILPDTPGYSSEVLTGTGDPGTLVISGTTVTVGLRVLVKDQASATQNGIYTVTDDGATPGPNWTLTRATDFDTAASPMASGSTLFNKSNSLTYVLDVSVTTIDTDAVDFSLLDLSVSSHVTGAVLPDTPGYSSEVLTSTGDPGTPTISVVGTGYSTGATTTTGGSGTGYTINIDTVGGSGEITAITITGVTTPYSSGDVLTVDGGTISATITLANALSVSGTVVSIGDRVLVNDQVTNTENGIYTVTDDSLNPGPNWTLIRATDFDSSATPIVLGKTTTIGTTVYCLDATVTTMDTDAVTFTEKLSPIYVDIEKAKVQHINLLRNQRVGLFSDLDKLYLEAISQNKDTSIIVDRQQYLRDITGGSAITSVTTTTELKAIAIDSWVSPEIAPLMICDYVRKDVATTTYTILLTDSIIGVTHTTTAAVTLTLPEISSTGHKKYIIKDEGGLASVNNITINVSGLDTIDGVSSKVMNVDYEKVTLYNNNGTGWFIV
jgi:hypothetical protein